MTKDDIIRMAREVGLLVIDTADGGEAVYTWPHGITDELERFAALVAAVEREACAKVLDDWKKHNWNFEDCAKVIRARGQE
jgi:hypothetical protein